MGAAHSSVPMVQQNSVVLMPPLGEHICTDSGSKPLKLVIVDDEPAQLCLYKRLLHDWFKNVTIRTFEQSDGALVEILNACEEPDLLITDLNNAPVSGFDLLASLAHAKCLAVQRVEYPIFVISALLTDTIEARIRQCTTPYLNLCFLSKPLDTAAFFRALESQFPLPSSTNTPAGNCSFPLGLEQKP